MFAPPFARRNFFKSPPNLKSWIRPWDKPTDMPQVTDKLYRVYLAMIGIKIHNDIGDIKSL